MGKGREGYGGWGFWEGEVDRDGWGGEGGSSEVPRPRFGNY